MNKALEALKNIKQDGNYCNDCGGLNYCSNYNTNKICGMRIEIDEAITELEAKDKAIENAIATIQSLSGEISKHSVIKILRDLKDKQ